MSSKRIVVIAACSLGLGACAGGPNWMRGFEATPPQMTLQLELEPAGAEARASSGQACQTPCALTLQAAEVSVTFTREGFEPQTVPVEIVLPEGRPDTEFGARPEPRFVPNPVQVQLTPVAPPPRRRAPARQTTAPKPTPTAKPAPAPVRAAPAPARPAAAPPPPPPSAAPSGPSPASPWPPVPGPQ